MSWAKTEPVRLYLYSLLAPVVAVLAAYGVLDQAKVPVIIALATALLGIGVTEEARAKVTPVARSGAVRVTSSTVQTSPPAATTTSEPPQPGGAS